MKESFLKKLKKLAELTFGKNPYSGSGVGPVDNSFNLAYFGYVSSRKYQIRRHKDKRSHGGR